MQWMLVVLLGIWPVRATAGDLPQAVAAQIERNPGKYLEDLAVLIAGYGRDGEIDRNALQTVVALARADARAVALRRLQGADLDGDGAIGGAEMRATAAALAATARGRLTVNFAKADPDGDDQVTAAELMDYANAAALTAFSEDKAAALYAILGFDSDGDGRVTVPEVERALNALASAEGRGREIHNQLQVQGHDDHSDQDGKRDQPARGGEGAHLRAVGGEHDQRNDREAEL